LDDRRAAIRREQLHVLLASVPVLLIAYFVVGALGSFTDRPFAVVLLLLPLLIAAIVLGYPLVRDRRLLLGGGFLPFFVAYWLLFSVAAGTRVLEGERATLAGFEAEAPSNVLGLSRLGDWHYLLARPAPPINDIVVVTLPSFAGDTLEFARRTQADLIARAVRHQAKGIAFDYTLTVSSLADRALCFWIERAEAAGVPVVYGYRVEDHDGAPVRVPLPPVIAECIAQERLGTLTGLLESDGRVRMVPTSHLADTTLRSFGWRIASLLARGEEGLPRVGLVQYVEPASPPLVLQGVPDETDAERFRDRFVIVGSHRQEDVRATPYDSTPGVLIHAFAAHGLRTGHIMRRIDARWLLPVIFALCWVLTLLQARAGGVRPLLLGAAIFSAAVLASAALAVRAGLLWVDVSYPLLAIWGMTGVLSGGARLQRGRTRDAVPPERPDGREPGRVAVATGTFDVFLSHNAKDKPAVIALAEALRGRGIRVWLDVWELVPGRPWQEALEAVIETAATAAVVIGRDGIGPWEEPEMRACLQQCVSRKMPVIPVLLPGVAEQPKLPLFLAQHTWVDLRDGLSEKGLDRLEWGITGIKPRRR
jgi:nucleotide-binding universal stress UspA family protein